MAVAAVICAWFVLGARQAHEINTATTLLNDAATDRSAAVQQRVQSLLNAASFIHPGVDVTLLRAQSAQNARDYNRAEQLIEQATSAEPDNIAAWIDDLQLRLLDPSLGGGNVFARLHELDPLTVYEH